MLSILFTILIVFILTLLGGIIWLFAEQKELKQSYDVLVKDLESHKKDLAGLCSAAVYVDHKILDNNEQLQDIEQKIIAFGKGKQQTDHPYYSAIQRIHLGATATELVQQCAINREEAELLIRLHG
ncbi:MAG: DUF2802 domain-containing protein [Methylococcales bacterium]|nr:DUF2802 domain-containing protein [Methylococcales bacterium]